ncbi:MAG TPA: BrnT family toxin [Anaerolineae bacterium]|nr:BrnT family toxin [Anaerolineae bacterium]
MNIRFTWDRQKADRNRQEHEGVTFEEAATVFRDPLAYLFDDDAHSAEEHRELIIGYSRRNRLLIVSLAERGDVIRIISARKADGDERRDYEQAGR